MQIMTPKEAAQYLRRSKRTLRRWDLAGTLKPAGRYPNGRPYYTRQQLDRFAGIKGEDDGEDRKDP